MEYDFITLESKIKQFDIKDILVVDDNDENIKAAEECFSKLKEAGLNLNVDYTNSEKCAIDLIKKKDYSLVITDLEMEEKLSGINVVSAATKNAIPAYIVTGYDPYGSHRRLSILPLYEGKNEKGEKIPIIEYRGESKTNSNSWKKVFEHCLISYEERIEFIKAMKRYKKEVGNLNDEEIKLILDSYYDLKLL